MGEKTLTRYVQGEKKAPSSALRLHRMDLPHRAVELGPQRNQGPTHRPDRPSVLRDRLQKIPEQRIEHRVLRLLGRVVGRPILTIGRTERGGGEVRGARPGNSGGNREELHHRGDVFAGTLPLLIVGALAAPLEPVQPYAVSSVAGDGTDSEWAQSHRLDRPVLDGEEVGSSQESGQDQGSRQTTCTRLPIQS